MLYTPIAVPDDPTYSDAPVLGDLGGIQAQVLYADGNAAQPPSYVLGSPNAPECTGTAYIYGTTEHDIVKVCPPVVRFITCAVVAARDNGSQQGCYPAASPGTPTPTAATGSSTSTPSPIVLNYGASQYRYKVVPTGADQGFQVPTYIDAAME